MTDANTNRLHTKKSRTIYDCDDDDDDDNNNNDDDDDDDDDDDESYSASFK